MVKHEDLLYFDNHKYKGPNRTIRGIIDLYEAGGLPKAEAIRIFRAFLCMQEQAMGCLVEDSESNEPNYTAEKTIQEHRKIYDEYDEKLKQAAKEAHLKYIEQQQIKESEEEKR